MSAWIASCYQADSGVDGSGNPVSAGSIVANLSHAAAAGNTILLAIEGGGGKTVSSIVDTQGNSWTVDESLVDGAVTTAAIARCLVAHGLSTSDTITINFSAANAFHMAVGELYTGSLQLDQVASCTPATTTAPTTAATPATGHSVETVFACLAIGGGKTRPTFAAASPYTVRQSNDQTNIGTNSARDVYSIDATTATAGAQTAAGTLSTSQPWDIVCATYFAATGGAGQTILAGFAVPSGGGSLITSAMIGFGLRGSGPDISGAAASYPWARCVTPLDFWSNIEPTDGAISFAGFNPSFQAAIDNGFTCGLRIEMATDGAPNWIYAANSLGPAVRSLTTFTSPSDSTGSRTPVPWDPTLRLMWKRLCSAVQAYLQTSYHGKTFGQVCEFFAVSGPTALAGTEMTIGDEGDSRNTANWNAVLSPVSARQAAYQLAWQNCTLDALQLINSTTISIANGTVWGDSRQAFMNICDYLAANLTPSQFARVLVGPTDLRTDQPGANSYAAWSGAADTAMRHALAKGLRTWGQTAGWSWWSQAFTGGTLGAIQTAYLTDGVGQYEMELVEANTQILGNVAGLPAWCQNTLQPAILAQQWSTGVGGGGSTSYGVTLTRGTGGLIVTGILSGQPIVYGPSFAPGAATLLAGAA